MGLPYPGGPAIQRVAQQGRRDAFRFPRSFLKEPERLQFSFSGLKTAVRYQVSPPGAPERSSQALSERDVADLAASFQEAVVDVLVGKSVQALHTTALDTLCVGGGVAANARFRERLEDASRREGFRLYVAPPQLCTDNAVMGAIAIERLRAGLIESLAIDIQPGPLRSN